MFEKESKMSRLNRIKFNSIQFMQTKAEQKLNPGRDYLSNEAKKRLRWMYSLFYECGGNVTRTAKKIGVSREWLSKIKSKFEDNRRDPRSLEPESRAPFNVSRRRRIDQGTEEKILAIRDEYGWGEDKIAWILKRDYGLKASPPTVNRYLHKHQKINPVISSRIKKAFVEKKEKEKNNEMDLKIKYRPPKQIKDYLPGALVEKDMKFVPKGKVFPSNIGGYKIKDYFFFQHSFLDSFTRIRGLELAREPDSQEAEFAYQKVKERMPFQFASLNTDNGGENEKNFHSRLNKDEVIHFYSRSSTPTDNPRVERSHLTDEKEFYQRQNIYSSFEEQRQALEGWEHIYNYIRPHQSLANLTPMEFYRLWKKNPEKAFQITEKWQKYLQEQRKRLAISRRLKRKEQIEKLMQFIEAKLNQKDDLNIYKLKLVNCELCS